MYYFCNFMNKELKGYKRELGFVKVTDELDAIVQPAECYMIERNGVKGLGFAAVSEKVSGTKVDFLGSLAIEKVGSTLEELVSSNDNPIIVVATKRFKVYKEIPSYVKYFPVQGGVIVALIKGYISVEDKNGVMIPLSRNCDAVSTNDGLEFNAEEVRKLNILKDKESGIGYSDFVVSDCVITYTVTKDGNKFKSLKFNKEYFVVLNKEVFETAKVRREAELKAVEEENKRRAKEIAEFNANYKKRMKEEEEKKKAEKSASRAGRPRKTSTKAETSVFSGSEGAQAFLECLAQLQNEA